MTRSAITFEGARATVRALGFSLRRTGYGAEVRLARPGRGNEAGAHYTDDLEDAIGTATAWFEREEAGPSACTIEHGIMPCGACSFRFFKSGLLVRCHARQCGHR